MAKILSVQFYGISIILFTFTFDTSWSSFSLNFDKQDSCFCQLQGQVDDCICNIDTVDYYNNAKIYPRISSLLRNDYFRYFRVNLRRPCPFWPDDSKCASEDCSVKTCEEDSVPPGLKPKHRDKYSNKIRKKDEVCTEQELGYLNTSISEESFEEFERWRLYDDAQDNFCELDDEKAVGMQYVDLLLNPERFTGYKGNSAHRIWRSIYEENCFNYQKYAGYGNTNGIADMQLGNNLEGLCLEKRVFFRAISGLHTSINIHLTANYYLSDGFSKGTWGPNMHEFLRRFSPETTKGEGPQWLKNLYFVYLLELRAIAKVAPKLEKELFYTGNAEVDCEVRKAVKDVLEISKSFPSHFNESTMFAGNKREAKKLKDEFKGHFRNISRIMDCVGCEKCKLWGKLQVQGLGTAFKILFSGDSKGFSLNQMKKDKFQLKRTEIVVLLNGFGRLSSSIQTLEKFRNLVK